MNIDREKVISVVEETKQRLSLERALLVELRERIANIEARTFERFHSCDLNVPMRSQSKH